MTAYTVEVFRDHEPCDERTASVYAFTDEAAPPAIDVYRNEAWTDEEFDAFCSKRGLDPDSDEAVWEHASSALCRFERFDSYQELLAWAMRCAATGEPYGHDVLALTIKMAPYPEVNR